jgi:exopolysaccharide/PEP-CTERM locus tyrosine autokinase
MSLIEKAAKHLEALQPAKDADAPHLGQGGASVRAQVSHGSLDNPPVRSPVSRQVDLDLQSLAAAGFVVPDAPNSLIAEEFRVIKRPLLENASGHLDPPVRNANLIMVTSALPQEGKSFVAVNLAMSIAMELERTALLVDADVARPSLPRLLGQPASAGLLDVLQDKSIQLSDVLLRTNVPALNLLMAGTPCPRATELLASGAMARLLDEMATRYADRIIVFDSPPLLMSTEARVLASHVGQIVFVVHAEETLQSALTEALATIENCPIKFAVLNQARNAEKLIYGYGR